MRLSPGTRLFTPSTAPTASEGDPWSSLAASVRKAPSPWSCAAFGELYERAMPEGRLVLRSFRGPDDARRADFAIDTLVAKLLKVAAADRPRAYFRTALYRDTVSWTRSGRARLATDAELPRRRVYLEGALDAEESRAIYRLDAREALDSLTERERIVLFADADGLTREEIAEIVGASRANVDQIISRARRRGAPGDA